MQYISTKYVTFTHRHICSRMLHSEEPILKRPELSTHYNKGLEVKILGYYHFSVISSCKIGVIFSSDIL